jgi:hypothetical protein
MTKHQQLRQHHQRRLSQEPVGVQLEASGRADRRDAPVMPLPPPNQRETLICLFLLRAQRSADLSR